LSIFAQNIDVSASLEKNTITIGDQITFNIEAKYKSDNNIQLLWPIIKDTIITNIEILEQKIDTSIHETGFTTEKTSYLITSFDSGYYAIPAFEIGVKTPNDTFIQRITTKPII
jgi:hypothetical protein